jgi:chromosome segregation ATPase
VETTLDDYKVEVASLLKLKAQNEADHQQNTKAIRRIAEGVLQFRSRIDQYESSLTKQVDQWTATLQTRLNTASHQIDELKDRQRRNEVDEREAQQAILYNMEETKSALKSALDRAVVVEEENELLRIDLNDIEKQKLDLERALQETRRYLEETETLVRSRQDNVGVEDFAKLIEKLETSEARAQEVAAESATAYADSTRTIAYLESECTRLRTLVDHFRCINVKLGDDVKTAHLEGVKV